MRAFPVRRRPVLLVAAALLLAAAGGPSGAQETTDPPPAVGGAFSAPFEENPAQQELCVEEADGRIVCKPVAVSTVALPDGRVLYWNGLEGYENIQLNTSAEAAEASRNSRARLLDLRSGTPLYAAPTPEDGVVGSETPRNSAPGDPRGVAGVPGRPGDGLVGSTVGQVAPGPSSAAPDDPEPNDRDMFCSYQVVLADGRVLVMGGTDWYPEPDGPGEYGGVELDGLSEARIFDPATDAFVPAGGMKYGRWYPSAVTLGDGKVFVASGVVKLIKSTQLSNVRRTETFDPATGQWTENYTGSGSETSLPLYPRMRLAPNGKIFYAASGQTWNPFGQAADEALWTLHKFFNVDTKSWETVGPASLLFRGSPLDVLLPMKPPYDRMTILQAGGVLGTSPGTVVAVPFTEEITVDAAGTVAAARTGDLNIARWFPMGVALPDGTVLAVSGGDRDAVVYPGMEARIRTAELYDPATRTWTRGATAERGRVYHNTAVLLADGRVLVGGHSEFSEGYGGSDFDQTPDVKDPTFEIYSPPYLFRGERPAILRAQAGVAYGQRFSLTVSSPTPIESVVLQRLGATTHVLDNDQRTLFLEFTQKGETLEVTAPPSGTVAPPGPYYLVVNRKTDAGPVPSVARIVTLGETANFAQALQPFPAQAGVAGEAVAAPDAAGTRLPATGGGAAGVGLAILTAAALLARPRRR